MRLFSTVTALFLSLVSVAIPQDILVSNQWTYHDAKVTQVAKHGVVVTHRGGADYVDFDDLPEDISKEVGWTPEKSAERKARMEALDKERWELIQQSGERIERLSELMRINKEWKPEPGENPEKAKERLHRMTSTTLASLTKDREENLQRSRDNQKARDERSDERFALERSLKRTDYRAFYWLGLGAVALAGLLEHINK